MSKIFLGKHRKNSKFHKAAFCGIFLPKITLPVLIELEKKGIVLMNELINIRKSRVHKSCKLRQLTCKFEQNSMEDSNDRFN